ncbi:MAG TPA: flagellar export chaperone FlgN [Terriglobia bacterium]|nr:flagellar export chaperone FlgN [Terriglobia bacterium]
MNREMTTYCQVLERRAQMLRGLAASLQNSQEAIARLDLPRLDQHTQEQENLCAGLRNLDREIQCCRQALAARLRPQADRPDAGELAQSIDAALAGRLRAALEELRQAQAELRQRSRVQAELLRRSRRSVSAMMNCLSDSLATYPPAGPPRGARRAGGV